MSRDGELRRARGKLRAVRSEMSAREGAEHGDAAVAFLMAAGLCCGCGSDLCVCACLCSTCGVRMNDHDPMPGSMDRRAIEHDVHAVSCLRRTT